MCFIFKFREGKGFIYLHKLLSVKTALQLRFFKTMVEQKLNIENDSFKCMSLFKIRRFRICSKSFVTPNFFYERYVDKNV